MPNHAAPCAAPAPGHGRSPVLNDGRRHASVSSPGDVDVVAVDLLVAMAELIRICVVVIQHLTFANDRNTK